MKKILDRSKVQRGVSVYSYSSLLGVCMTLEDCFKDMYDMGATCFELLTSHVEGYPFPTTEWVDQYWRLCEKYDMAPAEFGHWAESNLRRGPRLSDDEIVAQVIRDFQLANLLGFTTLRTKITTCSGLSDPEPGWTKYVERLLPYAEKYNVRMCTEIHLPTTLTTPHVWEETVKFIERTGTKYFGFNVDFSTFQNKPVPGMEGFTPPHVDYTRSSKPEDVIPLLPYVYDCHAKFYYMNDDFDEITIPYKKVIDLMMANGWKGCLLSEYEGPGKDEYEYLGDQLRRHHLMMSNILGY